LSVQVTTPPVNGVAVVNADQTISYTHDGSETTSDTLTYSINDGNGGVDTAIVSITVSPVNNPPVAFDDIALVDEADQVIIEPTMVQRH